MPVLVEQQPYAMTLTGMVCDSVFGASLILFPKIQCVKVAKQLQPKQILRQKTFNN